MSSQIPEAISPVAGKTTRAFEHICEAIRRQLISGTLRVGDKLPPEREMAEQFDVGRNAVREALRSLEMAGIVRQEKGRSGGAYIRPGNAARMTLAMRDLLDFGSISLKEITEARTDIMDVVTRLAVERATAGDLDELERIIDETDEFTRAGRMEERAESIAEFYQTIALSTGNRVYVFIVASLNDILRRFVVASLRVGDHQDTLVASRRRFLKHLRARDAKLASAEMRSQFLDLYRRIEMAFKMQSIEEAIKASDGNRERASGEHKPVRQGRSAAESADAPKAPRRVSRKVTGATPASRKKP